ncbi:hypothetical protein O0L34_g141 [Tuta absoluta]|nr:hypothetical protein O0L34_g141 [Tuta absoluta]
MASPASCGTCNLLLVTTDTYLFCKVCLKYHHIGCINIESAHYRENEEELKRSWVCATCANITLRRQVNKDDSASSQNASDMDMSCEYAALNHSASSQEEVKEANDGGRPKILTTSSVPPPPAYSLEQLAYLLDSKLDPKFDRNKAEILQKLDDTKSEIMLEVKQDMNDAIESIKAQFAAKTAQLSGEIKTLKGNLDVLETKVKSLENENIELKSQIEKNTSSSHVENKFEETISQLRNELNDRDQAALLNDVEVTGIPELQSESTVHIITAIATKLGVKINEQDIVSAVRVGSKLREETPGKNKGVRPRPIAVRLARRALRDELLKQARVRRGATTSDLGLPPHTPCRFYLNERLTKTNRTLFAKSLEASRIAKPHPWKFIWTKDGRVLARRTPTSTVNYIRSNLDINRIFCTSDQEDNQQL